MKPLLWLSFLRHLWRHRWQTALSVLGIALGVAVVLAVDLANSSAAKSFMLSMERITGRATHRIVGGPQGVPEAVYSRLRLELGLREVSPVVTAYAKLVDHPGKVLQVLGLDVFAERPFRAYLRNDDSGDVSALLTDPNSALLPRELGGRAELQVGKKRTILHAVGQLEGTPTSGLIVTDISTAQALFDKQGWLSHIDVIIPADAEGERLLNTLQDWLPPPLHLEGIAEHNRATADLSASFALNLTAMSLLALMVGMFLIYNSMTFSVVQRRGLLGMLRALGVTRRQIFIVVLGEALLMALAGILLGEILGALLGAGLIHLVTRTIDDLYYALGVREFFIAPLSLAKAAGLGLLATLAAAWLPAWEASAATPGSVLSRAQLEMRWQAALPRLNWAAVAVLGLGGLVLLWSRGLPMGFTGLFLIMLGCALLTPGCLLWLTRLNLWVWSGRLLARMATRDVGRHLSRTGIAVAALMVAFSATVGVGIMVASFRGGVELWIKDLVNADIYIAPPSLENDNNAPLHAEVLSQLRSVPGIDAVSTYRRAQIQIDGKPIILIAADLAPASQQGYRLIDGNPATAWRDFDTGATVIVSEPLAYRLELKAGMILTLPTPAGPHAFPIAAVFLDYGSEHGRILLHRSGYQRYWGDQTVGSAALFAAPAADLSRLRQDLEHRLGVLQDLIIRSNRDIQENTLKIFDRTFTITNVLRLLAVIVAFVGVLSALMALQLERAREFAVLRATGMTPGEIGWLVSLQTGFMGFTAGLLAIPSGLLLAAVLLFVINRRAFGWSLPFQVEPSILIQAIVLAVGAALLAGLYPVWRMARTHPAAALRSE